ISEAVRSRASDIHIEPMKDRVRVRYRIDGECVERDRIPLRMKGPLISRLKIMAGIDIAEKRLPQDGRIKLTVDKAQIDFRVSTLPAYHGESVVLRILRPDSVRIGIQNLGFEEDDYQAFKQIIKRPNGLLLVNGPTGHLVFSTLHTNDVPSAITRLIDMGVKPFLVASSIQAIMAQRLIRVLCPKCKQPDREPDPMWLKLAGITEADLKDKTLYKPRGCDYCTDTGFRGCIGIFEM